MSCVVVEPMLTGPVRSARTGSVSRSARPGSVSRSADGARLRLTRRGRLAVGALAVALGAAGLLGAQAAQADAPAAPTAVSEHVVAPGDTLWGIAASVAAPGEDVRDVVDRIVEVNGLEGSMLRAGQALLVPQP